MPQPKRKTAQAAKNRKKNKKAKFDEEDEFSDGFESPISEHLEEVNNHVEANDNVEQHEAVVCSFLHFSYAHIFH